MSDQRITDLQALLTETTRASDRQQREIDRLRAALREVRSHLHNLPRSATAESADKAIERALIGAPTQCPLCDSTTPSAPAFCTDPFHRPAARRPAPTLEATSPANWIGMPALALNESLESFRERVKQWKPTQDPTIEAVARAALLHAADYLNERDYRNLAIPIEAMADDPAAIAAVVAAGKEGA